MNDGDRAKTVRMAQSIVGDGRERVNDDYYITPPFATDALLSVEEFTNPVWEPACGNGSISKQLARAGYSVTSTDLRNRGFGEGGVDFFFANRRAGSIVTNPPYSYAEEFLERALLLADNKVAFLLKLTWLEGQRRREMFERTPLKKVWVFSKRLAMYSPDDKRTGGGMIAFAWYVWEHGFAGDPTIGWL